MSFNSVSTLIVALATLFSGCGKEPAPAPTPNEDKTTIELRQTNATDNTVEVAVTLKMQTSPTAFFSMQSLKHPSLLQ